MSARSGLSGFLWLTYGIAMVHSWPRSGETGAICGSHEGAESVGCGLDVEHGGFVIWKCNQIHLIFLRILEL